MVHRSKVKNVVYEYYSDFVMVLRTEISTLFILFPKADASLRVKDSTALGWTESLIWKD